MAEKLAKIDGFKNDIEAHFAKQTLENFGIKAVVTGANASNLWSDSLEQPKLLVPQDQLSEALEILKSAPNEQEE